QILEMLPQQVEVPHRLLGQAVVGDHHGALLAFGEAGHGDGRYLGPAQTLRRFQPAVASQDRARFVDKQWVGPDARSALHQTADLGFWMPPWVAGEGPQLGHWAPDDLFREAARLSPAPRTTFRSHGCRLGGSVLRHLLAIS